MGILGFGKVTKLEDFKIKDLKKERITQEVRQDQLLGRLRHAQEQLEGLLEAASEPGLSEAEIDVAAYKMDQISNTKDRSEQELQQTITRLTVIDSTIDVIEKKAELEKNGIWKKINSLPEEELEANLEALAIERKESHINLNNIVERFDVDRQTVQAHRSGGFRRSKDAILKRKAQKDI